MKKFIKSPLFYFNVGLVLVVVSLVFANSAKAFEWPNFVKKVIAAVQQITGRGTVNYLSAFSGTSSIGNSQIFDNGTNIGIGTANPQAKLEIAGGVLKIGAVRIGGTNVSDWQPIAGPAVVSNGSDIGVKTGSAVGSSALYIIDSNNNFSNAFANDYWVGSIGKWASQLGGTSSPTLISAPATPATTPATSVSIHPQTTFYYSLGNLGQHVFCSFASFDSTGNTNSSHYSISKDASGNWIYACGEPTITVYCPDPKGLGAVCLDF